VLTIRFEQLRERLRSGPGIAPSILSADFRRLGAQIAEAESAGAATVHFDVMDGRFVPNISIGVPVLESIRPGTNLPIETHLMIVEPEKYVERFATAGTDIVTVHVEATAHLNRVLTMIRDAGAVPGVTLNPATPLVLLEEVLDLVGLVLVMSVNPGFGGQHYLPGATTRIQRLAEMRARRGLDYVIEVDGGIHADTVGTVADAGCDLIVAGSAVFNDAASVAENIAALRAGIGGRAGG
jgi:ribulose-phosphate 3-epimerase